MKNIIITILYIVIISFNIFADDISEFEIEGISIGDSALDHVSEDLIITEIKRTSEHYKYLNNPDKFGEVYIYDGNFNKYSHISIFVKRDDKIYKIFMIRGMITFDVFSACLDLQKEIEMELGDLMFAVVNLARFYNIDPEGALKKSTNKFIRRFNQVEKRIREDGSSMEESDLETMDNIWNQIKKTERK